MADEDAIGLITGMLGREGMLPTITHDLDLAWGLGGVVLVMLRAEIVERGPVDRALSSPAMGTPERYWRLSRATGTKRGCARRRRPRRR